MLSNVKKVFPPSPRKALSVGIVLGLLSMLLLPQISSADDHNAALTVHVRTANRFLPLVGADVYLESPEWNGRRTTDGGGFVGFGMIPVGTYKVRISKPGVVDFQKSGVELRTDSKVGMAYVVKGPDAPEHWRELYSSHEACRRAHPEWNCRDTAARGKVEYYRSELESEGPPQAPSGPGQRTPEPPYVPPTHGAQYVSMDVPATMTGGRSYNVSVTMKNNGTQTWTPAGGFRLGSQAPQDNGTWGTGRIDLPSGASIAPGQSHTFSFGITAPRSAGTYAFSWRMLQEHVRWFGNFTPSYEVRVAEEDRSITGTIDGIFDENGQKFLGGWACAKTSNNPIDIHMYIGGPAGAGGGSTWDLPTRRVSRRWRRRAMRAGGRTGSRSTWKLTGLNLAISRSISTESPPLG